MGCALDCTCGRHNAATRKARLEELVRRHAIRDAQKGDIGMTTSLRDYLTAFDERIEAWRVGDTERMADAEEAMHSLLYGRSPRNP